MNVIIDLYHVLNSTIVLSNSLLSLLIFTSILAFGGIFKNIIARFISFLVFIILKNTTNALRLKILRVYIKKPIQFLLLLFVIQLSSSYLVFPLAWQLPSSEVFGIRFVLLKLLYQLVIIGITWLLLASIELWANIAVKDSRITSKAFDTQLLPFVKQSLKIVIVIFSFFFSLGFIFELNVTSIIAGLGIGGIAVALAGKETLENLISSFAIFLDKPFAVGDIVSVEGRTGTVEVIGFRSTRVRNFDKSLTVIPNRLMVDKSLDNLTNRETSRIMYKLNFPLHTPLNTLTQLIEAYKTYLDQNEKLDGSSIISFSDIDSGSYGITLIFFVKTNDLLEIILTKHETNLKIVAITESLDVRFRPPLQLIEINNQVNQN